jgi:hypothetical protein
VAKDKLDKRRSGAKRPPVENGVRAGEQRRSAILLPVVCRNRLPLSIYAD